MDTENENMRIIYEEIVELHKQQQSGFDLLYNKLNWILVSDVVFLVFLYQHKEPNPSVTVLVTLSAILVLIAFQPEKFNITAKITAQLENIDKDDFLKSLINKKREALNANNEKSESIRQALISARWLLIIAIAVQFVISIC